MKNCHDDVLAYHKKEVTLPQSDQDDMRKRRDANRKRLKNGLDKNGNPASLYSKSQGSYAMKTMLRHPENDYDIDDGVYFDMEELKGAQGGDMTAIDARHMVRDAVDDGSFSNPPEVRKNCIRVPYKEGYHVDIPVYRRVVSGQDSEGNDTYDYELASSKGWRRSDAREVTKWFNDAISDQADNGPSEDSGRQLRRVTRMIKKFAKSRESWSDKILSGFGITALVVECFRPDSHREDRSLYETMKAIKNRLQGNLVVKHPVTPGEEITEGVDDSKARFLFEKLDAAVEDLAKLFENECTRKDALSCWDKAFGTKFFRNREEENSSSKKAAAAAVASAVTAESLIDAANASPDAVRRGGGGRYA